MARSYSLKPQGGAQGAPDAAPSSPESTHVLERVEDSAFVSRVDPSETQALAEAKASELRDALSDDNPYADAISGRMSPGARRVIIIVTVVVAAIALAVGVFFLNRLGVFDALRGSRGEDAAVSAVVDDGDEGTSSDAAADVRPEGSQDEAVPDADSTDADGQDVPEGDGGAEADSGGAKDSPAVEDGGDAPEETPADDGREWLTYGGYALTQGVADSSSATAKIDGFFRNDTDETHENVSLGIYLSDRDGVAIGLATALIERIEPGEVVEWHATSDIDFSQVYRFQIADVRF